MSTLNPVALKTYQDSRSEGGLGRRSNAPGGQVATSTSTSAFGVPKSAFAKAKTDDTTAKSINTGSSSKAGLQSKQGSSTNIEGSNSTSNTSESTAAPKEKLDSGDLVNPLHDYEPINYFISLSCLSSAAFNTGDGDQILIAQSAGKGGKGIGDDYYIDNLVVRNSLSPTAGGANSGTIYQVSFDVTEPYGTSFTDALITASKDLGYTSHLQAVFQLQIQFRGVDDDQNPAATSPPKTTRTIPITIRAVDVKIEAGVSTYACQAVPTTGLANTELHGVTKEAITVVGNTVQEVIQDFFSKINSTQTTLKKGKKLVEADEFTLGVDESDKEILEARIPYDTNSSMQNTVQVKNLQAGPPNQRGRFITVPAGTSVQLFIEAIVKESDFVRSQFEPDMQPKSTKDDFMRTLRTFSRVEILSNTGGGGGQRPVYKFIWILRPQKVSANYFKKEAVDLVKDVRPVRTYDYLYTGKNKDILAFDLTYRFAYFQPIPYFDQGGDGAPPTDAYSANDPAIKRSRGDTTGQKGAGTSSIVSETTPTRKDGFIASLNTVNGEATTLFEQILNDPAGDLLVVQMEILGDPLWIEQKTVSNRSFAGSHNTSSFPLVDANGAVVPDAYEVYVEVNFKTPTDLDDDTGLFKIQDAASFGGKYAVYLCESNFAGGLYTNVLQMRRMRHQETDKKIDDKSRGATPNDNPNNRIPAKTAGTPSAESGGTAVGTGRSGPGGQYSSANASAGNISSVGSVVSNNTTSNVAVGTGGFDPGGFDGVDAPVPKLALDIGIEFVGNKNRLK